MNAFCDRVELIRRMPAGSAGCEVGVFRGDFSNAILATHLGRLHLVDCWKHYPEYGRDSNNVDDIEQEKIYQGVLRRFDGEIRSGRVIVHRKMSVEAALTDFKEKSLDWVYLDSNHLYDFVLADLRIWSSRVKDGGFLCGHDWTDCPQARDLNFGVQDAVKKFCEETSWKLWGETLEPCASFCLKLQ